MIYLEEFHLLSDDQEWNFFRNRSKGCYDSFYPYQLFPQKQLREITFSDITVFCGSNGSGKSTVLNIIGEKLALNRYTAFRSDAGANTFLDLLSIVKTTKKHNNSPYAAIRALF